VTDENPAARERQPDDAGGAFWQLFLLALILVQILAKCAVLLISGAIWVALAIFVLLSFAFLALVLFLLTFA